MPGAEELLRQLLSFNHRHRKPDEGQPTLKKLERVVGKEDVEVKGEE